MTDGARGADAANPAAHAAALERAAQPEPTTRFAVKLESPPYVTLDGQRQPQSLVLEIPVSALRPPMRPDELRAAQSYSYKINVPPSSGESRPVEIIERKNGKFIRIVAGPDLNAGSLQRNRMLLAFGPAEDLAPQRLRPGVAVSALKFSVEVETDKILVDTTASGLAQATSERRGLEGGVAWLRSELRAMTDGTSSWFGTRNFEQEIEATRAELAPMQEKLDGLRRDLFAAANEARIEHQLLLFEPREVGATLRGLFDAKRQADDDVTRIEGLLADVAAESADIKAYFQNDLDDARTKATAADEAFTTAWKSEKGKLDADIPNRNTWILAMAQLANDPRREEVLQLASDAAGLAMNLEQLEKDWDRLQKKRAQNVPLRIEELRERIASTLARWDHLKGVEKDYLSGSRTDVQTFMTEYRVDQ